MKNLFTLPMEEGKSSSFEKYIIKNISLNTEKEINEMNIKINEFQKNYKRIFTKISSLCMLIAAFSFFVGLFSISKNSTYSILGFSSTIIFLALSFFFVFLDFRQTNKIQNSKEYLELNEEAEKIIEKAHGELGLSRDNNACDIYLYYYVEKNGKITSGLPFKSLMVKEYLLSKDDEYFYLGDVYNVIKLPLNSIKGFNKHESTFSFYGWSKKELPNKGIYKQYKIKPLNNMYFKIKDFYSLDLELNGEEVSIYFAIYDKDIVENILELNK